MADLNYKASFEELQKIVAEIEGGNISVDDLAVKVKTAAELIKTCKDKLNSTESNVNAILEELEKPSPIDRNVSSSASDDLDLPF